MTAPARFVFTEEAPPNTVAATPAPTPSGPAAARRPSPRPSPGPLRRVPLVPPLEPHLHNPPEARHRHRLDKYVLALQIDARLALRAQIEHRVERARAAVARLLIDSRAHEAAGYTNLRDYAREELGLSLRSLQDLVRLDRALAGLPRIDAAVLEGRLAPSRALAVLAVATPENEEFWLAQACKRTYRQLVQRVRVYRETRPDQPENDPPRATEADAEMGVSGPEEPAALLLQRKPPRSQFLWEGFVEEASRSAGRNLSEGEALEILLAEFWTLVPPTLTESLPEAELEPASRPTARTPVVLPLAPSTALAEDALADADLGPESPICTNPHQLKDADGYFIPPYQTDGRTFVMAPLRRRGDWRRELLLRLERDYGPWKDLDRRATSHAASLMDQGTRSGLVPEDEKLLDTSGLDAFDGPSLARRFLALRALRRRLAVDQGALLHLVRGFQLYRALQFASFGHYTRERFGMGRRTAEDRADLHRLLGRQPALRRAYVRDRLSDGALLLFRRLMRSGIRGRALRPWVARARRVPVSTLRDQVRWIEAVREGWQKRHGHCGPYGPRPPRCPQDPPSYREWVKIRLELNASPEAFALLAAGCGESWQMSARPKDTDADAVTGDGGAADLVDSVVDGLSASLASPAEPATRTCRVTAPEDVARSYLRAVEAVRLIFGWEKPAWWCQEIMMLYVRRDWMQESRHARRNMKYYAILERDGFCCAVPGCTSRKHLHVHHIVPLSQGGTDDPSNMITLCSACHLFGLHRMGVIRVRGRAPHRLLWDLGLAAEGEAGDQPRRRYLGEFRRRA